MKKRVFVGLALVALMAGCSSGVKLNDVPVESRTPTNIGDANAKGPGTTQSNVPNVDVTKTENLAPGPQNVGRIVYFDYDSYVIKPEFQSLLDAHARYLKANNARHISIEGHTDERGGREYNLALGQKRSEAVRRALGLLGVADQQMEAVSFGKEKPAEQGNDEAAYAKNRRAEIAYR